jgi:hypothetical protein
MVCEFPREGVERCAIGVAIKLPDETPDGTSVAIAGPAQNRRGRPAVGWTPHE